MVESAYFQHTMNILPSPSQPFLGSSRNAPEEERCVTRLKTAAKETEVYSWYVENMHLTSLETAATKTKYTSNVCLCYYEGTSKQLV